MRASSSATPWLLLMVGYSLQSKQCSIGWGFLAVPPPSSRYCVPGRDAGALARRAYLFRLAGTPKLVHVGRLQKLTSTSPAAAGTRGGVVNSSAFPLRGLFRRLLLLTRIKPSKSLNLER